MPFEMAPLRYSYDALEPVIDARTVEIHYSKHHATYLKNLNAAIEKFPQWFEKSLEEILADLSKVPEEIRTAVKNNGGGVFNHNLYWTSMAPGLDGKPVGKLASRINENFGSFDQFKTDFEKAALSRFGSGYAWLSLNKNGVMLIHSTANQDCPLSENLYPILVVDVWEHAYYLNYQNRRADYLANWWKLVNWEEAEKRFIDFRK